MIRKAFVAIALVTSLAVTQPSFAQTAPVANLGFKLGDDVATVKAALNTDIEPEAMVRNPLLPSNAPDINRGKTVLHLRTKGIWVFFNPAETADTIRLDAPFAGTVLGIKLGDTTQQMLKKLGNPLQKPNTIMGNQSYKYVLDDSAYVSFTANDDGVQTIFITK